MPSRKEEDEERGGDEEEEEEEEAPEMAEFQAVADARARWRRGSLSRRMMNRWNRVRSRSRSVIRRRRKRRKRSCGRTCRMSSRIVLRGG